MSDLAQHGTDYSVVEHEPPELLARNLRVASQLWSSAVVFFFLAFLFAYFYLRSLNQNHLWHPHGVKAPVTLGTLIAIAIAASAAAVILGERGLRAGRGRDWLTFGGAGLGLAVVAVVLQIVEWSTIGFGPTDGGFASVFLGWTGLYLLFVVCSLYWLETLLATAYRYRGGARHEPGHASGDRHRSADDVADPLSLLAPGASAFGLYWAVLAGIGVITWIVLYLL